MTLRNLCELLWREHGWIGQRLALAPIIDCASWEEVLPGKEKPETVALALLLGGGTSCCVVLFDEALPWEVRQEFLESLEWQVERLIGLPRKGGSSKP